MAMTHLYSHEDIRSTYEPIDDHRQTSQLIQRYAANARDIREVALEGLRLTGYTRVIDLGCGYGFFTEKLRDRLAPSATIVGVDVVNAANRQSFEETVSALGYGVEYIHGSADLITEMDDACWDLVVASYSLYFFPHLIPQISRILRPGGIFIALTHSRHSLKEAISLVPGCMKISGLDPPGELRINRLFEAFSLEGGYEQLRGHFARIERIVYENTLTFPHDQIRDCIKYFDKKRHLIFKEVMEAYPYKVEEVLSRFNRAISEQSQINGKVTITKDDAVFRCSHSGQGVMQP
ncbi:MAG TPA: class I SAM-dependent methyltransferase [Deltaproteobacteria bacterium]|nr:class I SAM-dependent methyltransferase [Deltaproteobacteria bacterium]